MLKSVLEIYNSVWSSPLSKLAKDWDINPTLLAKLCDKHSIPRPQTGYWTKISLEQTLPKPRLPNTVKPEDVIDLTLILKKSAVPSPFESSPTNKIRVPKALHSPHKLTTVAKELYKKSRFPHGRLMEGAWLGETYRISVSPACFQRALRVMDTLIKEFERRGWPFEAKRSDYVRHAENTIRVDNNLLKFKLREKLKQTKRTLTPEEEMEKEKRGYVYHEKVNEPTGVLMLILEHQVKSVGNPTIIDNKKFCIEDKLGFFFDWIIEASEVASENKIKRRQEDELRQKQSELTAQFDSMVKDQESKIEDLFSNFSQWQKVEQGRQFLNAVKTKMAEQGALTQNQNIWLEWAKNIITLADPIEKVIQETDTAVITDEISDSINTLAIRNKLGIDVDEKDLQISRDIFENVLLKRRKN
jgi:hypothetical protein